MFSAPYRLPAPDRFLAPLRRLSACCLVSSQGLRSFRLRADVVMALLLMVSISSSADDLPAPSGTVLLTATGNLAKSNSSSGVELDLAMLESLPAVSFSTETPWTEGKTEWTGVRLNDLLEFIGAESTRFHATALDSYEVTFENVDVNKYPAILAYKLNGEYMSVRDLGPLWIMFPFDDYPELDNQFNRTIAVWQLTGIKVL